ncbi:chemotaxis protein [Rhodospirillum rubrum]|uniref:PAS domain-containing protein n=1 Tax=Rhodospirillum rubrum TaxID=1085 RepID=UPI00190709FE|nr:PAS domain-containing protein [Rhodospirillum rubrum]MBK1663818.1 chemotaxis protein [Rhodospirillum rubrum]MBK1675843.1 chemotaxis protein [Rhodospirillum rubrum]
MSRPIVTPSGVERFFGEDQIIVSKTDLKGIITYANDVFLKVAGYKEGEILGKPHNIIRHPDMPACVFKLLWDRIPAGHEVFAYVINMAKNGDHYWVYAHITPTFSASGQVIGYHSSRRVPEARVLPGIKDLYAALLDEERRHASPKDGMAAAMVLVEDLLAKTGQTYDEFIHGL